MLAKDTKYNQLTKADKADDIEINVNDIDEVTSNNVCKSDNSKCQKERNHCKLLIHSIIFISFIIFIIAHTPIRLFIFCEIIIILILFDTFYLFLMIFSKHLHWFHFDLISIDGIITMAIPIPAPEHLTAYSRVGAIPRCENKYKLMGSISELSAYPGSTSNYIIQSCSSYIFTAMSILTILIIDEQYNYNFNKYPLEITSLLMIYIGSFGFFLAGHWSVFESKLSTLLHVIGFLILYLLSTVAIWIQQRAHWLCIVALLIGILILIVYSYIRSNYLQMEFENRKHAHNCSIYEILLEWVLVLIIQAQCCVFMWNAMNDNK